MAHNRDYRPEDIAFPDQIIRESELVDEMEKSYIEYAMSVIVGRALPDVRDGLKPVHRRILYSMYENGLTADKPFKKSATCVGDVLGRYHPHGDASVYDAMVRLAQDFSMRYMLVDGHGNFGSVDGDPPAAYRYTEARLARISDEMLRDIDKETVDWVPNFDESLREPSVLPARFPNLLVNGSSGIAVGMATNIPPHNLREVIGACICVLDDPEATLADLMEHVQGPDFPTRGIIMGRSGIRAAYATGRGRLTVRARYELEEHGRDRVRIVVSELPYQVNKRQLIRDIADQVKDKRLEGISDLRDETDRNGMRIVIELKKEANPQVLINRLFSQTQLQATFAVNMLALVDDQKQPRILSLRHIIDEYLAFQQQIILRRTRYDLKKAQERAHLLEGLLIAQDNIDEVVHIIRTSYDNAKENLMQRFGLDDVQAQAILEMRLRALQGLDRDKLHSEYAALEEKIAYYQRVLGDMDLVRAILKEELQAIADKYGDERKTEIQDVEDEIDVEDLIPRQQCVYTLTHAGYVKRLPLDTYAVQHRGGRGITGLSRRDDDFVEQLAIGSSHDPLLFVTDRGRVFRMKGYRVPEGGRTARGANIVNLLALQPQERVIDLLRIDEKAGGYLVMVTAGGTVKRTPLEQYANIRKNGLIAISLEEGDTLAWCALSTGSDEMVVATAAGNAIRFAEQDCRSMGRTAHGVRAIRLGEGDRVVGGALVRPEAALLTVTEQGKGRCTLLESYRTQRRGGQGLRNYAPTDRVAAVRTVQQDDDVILISQEGVVIRIHVSDIRPQSRYGSGVRLMRLAPGDRVVTLARTPRDEDAPAESVEQPAEDDAEAAALEAQELAAAEADEAAGEDEADEAAPQE